MENDRRQHRRALAFTLGLGILIASAVGIIAVAAVENPHLRPTEPPKPAVSRAGGESILLIRDRGLHVKDLILTYRGRRDGQIDLEVVIPALDPQFAYAHRIPLDRAKDGFRVAGQNLSLMSARASRARFHLDP